MVAESTSPHSIPFPDAVAHRHAKDGGTGWTNWMDGVPDATTAKWLTENAIEVQYAGIIGSSSDVVSSASPTCTECYELAERPVCRSCVSHAQHHASQRDVELFKAETHELHCGLSDCLVDVPEEWHEKPLARFSRDGDDGDASVGIGAMEAWVLTADQSGTILSELLAARHAPAELTVGDHIAVPRQELTRLRNVLALAAHPSSSPHAGYIDGLLASSDVARAPERLAARTSEDAS